LKKKKHFILKNFLVQFCFFTGNYQEKEKTIQFPSNFAELFV